MPGRLAHWIRVICAIQRQNYRYVRKSSASSNLNVSRYVIWFRELDRKCIWVSEQCELFTTFVVAASGCTDGLVVLPGEVSTEHCVRLPRACLATATAKEKVMVNELSFED
eukprot:6985881-Pyramimonas_sp.AAC.5